MNKGLVSLLFALMISAFSFRAYGTEVITTVAGNGTAGYSGDKGPATSAELDMPRGVAVDGSGNFYIADSGNNVIRKVDHATGIIATVAGNGAQGYGGDKGPATSAELDITGGNSDGVAFDGSGNLYIADKENSVIRKVDHATGIITTVAGDGTPGYSGNNGPATSAELDMPDGVAVDSSGNFYIADSGNNVIRKVDHATGIITVVAGDGTGNYGYSGDKGPATSAELYGPEGVAVDGSDNLYIADTANNVIRKVDHATGIITTVAGDGTDGYSGDNGPATSAELDFPEGVAVDGSGNLYIPQDGFLITDNAIRKVDHATGIITTIAGNGARGYGGDNGPAINAELNQPEDVAVDSSGNLYIADTQNNVIRLVKPTSGLPAAPTGLSAAYGSGQVNLSWTASSGAVSYNVYEGTGPGGELTTPVASGITGTSTSITGLSNGPTYYFTVRAVNDSGISIPSAEATATTPNPAEFGNGGGGAGAGAGAGGGMGPETLFGLLLLLVGFSTAARRERAKSEVGGSR